MLALDDSAIKAEEPPAEGSLVVLSVAAIGSDVFRT